MSAPALPATPPEGPSVTRRLYGLLLPYRRAVAWGMTFLTLSVAAELYPPLVWGKIIDHGLTRQGNAFTAHWSYIGWQLAIRRWSSFGTRQAVDHTEANLAGRLFATKHEQVRLDVRKGGEGAWW